MDKTNKDVTIFCDGFKYHGELLEETDLIYKILDYKEKIIIKLPISKSVIKYHGVVKQ